MKKTFVTLATVAALVAAAAPVLATESVFDETLFNTTVPVESPEYPANTVQTNPEIENQKAVEATPAPTYAEENNTPGNPGEEEFVTVEIPVDVDGDGKTDRIDVKRVSTGVWVNKGEEVAPTEETATTETATTETASTSTTTASANTGKTAAKTVAAAKTTTGAKTLPKTSAAK